MKLFGALTLLTVTNIVHAGCKYTFEGLYTVRDDKNYYDFQGSLKDAAQRHKNPNLCGDGAVEYDKTKIRQANGDLIIPCQQSLNLTLTWDSKLVLKDRQNTMEWPTLNRIERLPGDVETRQIRNIYLSSLFPKGCVQSES